MPAPDFVRPHLPSPQYRPFLSSCEYEVLDEQGRMLRRTVADALEVLRTYAGFDVDSQSRVSIGALRLPSQQVVYQVQLFFIQDSMTFIVSLPTSVRFQARCIDGSQRESFHVPRLDQAVVGGDGTVTLHDGLMLRAVEVTPALLPLEPSELDWRIVHATLSVIGAKARCYRGLFDAPVWEDDLYSLDCNTLDGLELPPLKVLAHRLAAKDPALTGISKQQIADSLKMFGIRIPIARPRQGHRGG